MPRPLVTELGGTGRNDGQISFVGGTSYPPGTIGYEAQTQATIDSFSGIDPTGVTECSAAMTSAITLAALIGVKMLRFPGAYKLATVVTFVSNMRYEITGSFNFSASQEKGVFVAASSSNIIVEGHGLGGMFGPVSDCMYIGVGCNNIRLYGMEFTGATLEGTGHSAGVWCDGSVTGFYVDRCYFHGNGRGVITDGSGDNLDLMVYINGGVNQNVHIGHHNRFVSTAVSYNAIMYDCKNSSVGASEFSGAVCEVGSLNKGYGLAVYATVKGNVDTVTITGPCVHDTQGSGIYFADPVRVTLTGAVITNVATVQVDSSLPVAGIAVNGGFDVALTGNIVRTSGRDGIAVTVDSVAVGVDQKIVVTGGSVDNCTQSGYRIRGALDHAVFVGIQATNCDRNFFADTAAKDLTLQGSFSLAKSGGTGAGVDITGATNSRIDVNCHKNARQGMLIRAGAHNEVTGSFTDNGTETDNTYDGIFNVATSSTFRVTSGNTGATGQRYGLNTTGDYCNVLGCNLTRNRTDGYAITGTNVTQQGNRLSTSATPGPAQGVGTLSGGTLTVTTDEVRATDHIVLCAKTATGTLRVSAVTAGTSFVVTSSNGADSGSFTWSIVH